MKRPSPNSDDDDASVDEDVPSKIRHVNNEEYCNAEEAASSLLVMRTLSWTGNPPNKFWMRIRRHSQPDRESKSNSYSPRVLSKTSHFPSSKTRWRLLIRESVLPAKRTNTKML
jgi:predicted ATP-binding protein involved in virulence